MKSRIVVGWALLCLVVAGCADEAPVVKPSAPPTVVVTRPVVRQVADREEFTGRTDAVYSVDVLSRVSGYLTKVCFKDGDEVKQGEVLFEVDPRPYQAELARTGAEVKKAEAHAKRLEADYQRASHLYERGVIGRQEYDLVVGDRDEAKAALRSAMETSKVARLNVEWTKVTARISGLASRRMVDPGTLVKAESTVLTNIVTQDPLYVYFDVDERTMLRLRDLIAEGSIRSEDGNAVPVSVALADEEDFSLTGTLDFSENKTDPNTGTLRVRGTIQNPKPYMLSAGMFVSVRLPIGAPKPTVLVPEPAIGTDQGRRFVYVVNDRDEVVYRPVSVGFAEGGLRVVKEGLRPGERVVTNEIQRLRPGVKVVPQAADPASVSAPQEPDGAPKAHGVRVSRRD